MDEKNFFAGTRKQAALVSLFGKTISYLLKIVPGLSVIYTLASVFTGLAGTGMLVLWKQFIDIMDNYFNKQLGTIQTAVLIVITFCVCEILMYLWGTLTEYFNDLARIKIERTVILGISAKCDKLPLEYFEMPVLYDYINRARDSALPIFNVLLAIQLFFSFASRLLTSGIVLLYEHVVLILVILFAAVPSLLARIIRGKKMFNFHYEVSPEKRKLDYYKDCITTRDNFKETRTLRIAGYFIDKWRTLIREITRYEWKTNRKMVLIFLFSNILRYCGFAAGYALSGWYLVKGEISVGLFVLATGIMITIQPVINSFIESGFDIYENILKAGNLFQFFTIKEAAEGRQPCSFRDKIELVNISYTYPGTEKPALDCISLEIRKGEKIAIVGRNGSGKSTLVKIIIGLLYPTAGKVLYDNSDLNDASGKDKMFNKTAVFQDFNKFYMTIRENTGLGNTEYIGNYGKIRAALENSDFNYRAAKYKNGIDTMLGKEFEGTDLSGGEWQKVAIARGIFKDYEIIILDEPTASLDPVIENDIFNRFLSITQDKTTVLVTHRLGCTKFLDRIIVLEEGRIIEDNNHEYLMNQNGIYAEMYRKQSQWYSR